MPSKQPPTAKSRCSLRTEVFLATLVRLSLTVAGTTLVAFLLGQSALNIRTVQQLQSAAITKKNALETTIAKEREQLSILARDPLLASLPSIVNLVGFHQLLLLGNDDTVRRLSGGGLDNIDLSPQIRRDLQALQTSFFVPLFTENGWDKYLIAAPQINASGKRTGTLIGVFDATALAARLLDTSYLGTTAEVLLVTKRDGDIVLFRGIDSLVGSTPIHLNMEQRNRLVLPERTLAGRDGFDDVEDYAGVPVLAAYRSVPSIGWGVIVQIDRYELTAPMLRLAGNLAGTGLVLVILFSLSAFFLAKRIVGPLEELTNKLDGLEARHWRFQRTIFTGDELGVVDAAADSLTKRLRQAHDHLERIVRVRTEALRAEHAQDAAILESIDYGLLVTNQDGDVIYLNTAGERLTGWKISGTATVPYTRILALIDKGGKDIPLQEHPIATVLERKERFNPPVDPEYSLRQKNKSITALQIRATPILRGRRCLGVVAVFRDISEERKIDHMKSEFISLVSHQLRTPLSSMRWYLEMLLSKDAGSLSPGQQQYVEEIAASNARMVHLVNALLNVSRLELGKVEVIPETIDITKLIEETATSFRLELERKSMTIEYSPRERATIEVRSDRGLLQLIVENMVSNAIKYGKESTTVTIRATADKGRRRVTIAVTDKGIGIPLGQQEHIFRKLFRGSNARLSDTNGSGLGLYVSHVAAESIGAKLTFKSKEGVGTTFIVSLPLAKQSRQQQAEQRKASPST